MARQPHRSNRTTEEFHRFFADALAPLGVQFNDPIAQRIFDVRVKDRCLGDVRLGDIPPTLQKRDSNFYDKEYNEVKAVAIALVQLGLDCGATLELRDKPDVDVTLGDGSTVYVEHRFVGEQHVVSMPRYAEDIDRILAQARASDPAFDNIFDGWNVTVRLPFIDERRRSSPRDVAAEIVELARELAGAAYRAPRISDDRYPILTAYRATISARPVTFKTASIVQTGEATWIGNDLGFTAMIHAAIDEKRAKAKGYDVTCQPLWLVLTIADERIFGPAFYELLERDVRRSAIMPFQRVIVCASSMKPIIRE